MFDATDEMDRFQEEKDGKGPGGGIENSPLVVVRVYNILPFASVLFKGYMNNYSYVALVSMIQTLRNYDQASVRDAIK